MERWLPGGSNGYGQCNVPAGLSQVIAVAGGGYHSLALKSDGTVVAWGWNDEGQCKVHHMAGLDAGYYHGLALKSDGTVAAWGDNTYGQCNVPAGLSRVVAVAGGGSHSLALESDGTVVAWGGNTYGQCNVPGRALPGDCSGRRQGAQSCAEIGWYGGCLGGEHLWPVQRPGRPLPGSGGGRRRGITALR